MFLQVKSTDAPQSTADVVGGGGEASDGGDGEVGGAMSGEDVKPKDNDKKVDSTPQEKAAATAQGKPLRNDFIKPVWDESVHTCDKTAIPPLVLKARHVALPFC